MIEEREQAHFGAEPLDEREIALVVLRAVLALRILLLGLHLRRAAERAETGVEDGLQDFRNGQLLEDARVLAEAEERWLELEILREELGGG